MYVLYVCMHITLSTVFACTFQPFFVCLLLPTVFLGHLISEHRIVFLFCIPKDLFCICGGDMDYIAQPHSSKSQFYNLSYTATDFGNALVLLTSTRLSLKPLTAALLPPVPLCVATVRCGRSVWVARYAEMMWEVRRPRSDSVGNVQMF